MFTIHEKRIRRAKKARAHQDALFEADGGSWRLEAVTRIKTWITREVPGTTVIA
jgi:hypothetical protein